MSDTSGLPSAIGIEAVEWLTDEPGGMTVRITGRWRRRRPEWRGPAMLVIEADGRRHRIPAMPEAPFLIGLLPGMWRMSFSIPSELADHLEGGTWLALGAVMVPITLAPPGAPAPSAEPPPVPRPPADRELLAARELRSLEVAAQSARRRAREADETAAALRREIADLQVQLERARQEPERLRSVIEARIAELRRARQDLHAETARRAEREEDLAEQERTIERLRERARAMAQREYELERDLRRMRRAVDEAQRRAAIAQAPAGQAPEAQAAGPDLTREFALAARPVPRLPRPVVAVTRGSRDALAMERALGAHPRALQPDQALEHEHATLVFERDALTAEVTREREARHAAEQRVEDLQADLERQRERSRRALAAIEGFRRELHELRVGAAPAPAPPAPAPAVPQPPHPEPLDTAFEPERLSAALARLREQHAPQPEPAAPPAATAPATEAGAVAQPTATTDALPRLFRALATEDATASGRLVLALLPAQRRVHPRPVAYDLVLGPAACVRVTVGDQPPVIELASDPRPLGEVQVRVDGEPAALAKLLAAGPVRARIGRGVARVAGDRRALDALRALVRTPLRLDDLVDAGVSLDPGLALRLVAAQLGSSATEAFSIAHRPSPDAPPDAVLHASPGRAATVTETALELPATATIVCAPGALLSVLAGRRVPGASIRGDGRALALLRRAMQRA